MKNIIHCNITRLLTWSKLINDVLEHNKRSTQKLQLMYQPWEIHKPIVKEHRSQITWSFWGFALTSDVYQLPMLETLEGTIVLATAHITTALEEFEKVRLHWILKYHITNFRKKIFWLLVKMFAITNNIKQLWHLEYSS